MASRSQRGCLRQDDRKDGKVWKLRYYTARAKDGGRVERTLFVGYVRDFPTESDAWREVDRQRLTEKINNPTLRAGKLTFRQIAEHFIDNDLLNSDVIKPKAQTTKDCYKHVIRAYLIERWGSEPAIEIGPADAEDWLQAISIDKDPEGLDWPTLSKMRNIMSLIYAHAQRKNLIPNDVKYNPVRPSELGGARCRCSSDYEAVILKPQQTFSILNSLPLLQQTMVVLDAATGLRYSEIAGLKWQDVDWENRQIHVRRRWIRDNVSDTEVQEVQGSGGNGAAAGEVSSCLAVADRLREGDRLGVRVREDPWANAPCRQHAVRRLSSPCRNQGGGGARKGPAVRVP